MPPRSPCSSSRTIPRIKSLENKKKKKERRVLIILFVERHNQGMLNQEINNKIQLSPSVIGKCRNIFHVRFVRLKYSV